MRQKAGSGHQWVNEAPVGGLWTWGGSSELTPAVLWLGITLWNEAICLCWAALGQHPSACQKIGLLFEPDVQKQARRIPVLPLSLQVCLSLPSFALGLLPIPPLFSFFSPPYAPSPVPWWRCTHHTFPGERALAWLHARAWSPAWMWGPLEDWTGVLHFLISVHLN